MFVILFICLLPFCFCQIGGEIKYVLNFDSPIYPFGAESEEFVDCSEVYVERHNESHAYMHGNIIMKKTIEEKTVLEIVVLKEGSAGKFEVMFSHEICNFCDEIGDEGSDYRKHLKPFGLPSACPIAPGSYKIHDMCMDVDDMELSSSHLGRYECQLNICKQTGDSCKDRDCMCRLKMDLMIEEVIE